MCLCVVLSGCQLTWGFPSVFFVFPSAIACCSHCSCCFVVVDEFVFVYLPLIMSSAFMFRIKTVLISD